MNPIKHLVVLMMENRSFDHFLGGLTLEGRADIEGLPNPLPAIPDKDGNAVASAPLDGVYDYPDLPHGWATAHADYNNGTNDGFVREYQQNANGAPNIPMGYYTRRTLPVLYSLADEFTVCDHWFCSVLSSTWPNRKYFHSGKRDSDNDTQTLPPLPGFQTTPFYSFLEQQADPDAPDQNLTWKCYYSDLPFLGFWYEFAALHLDHFTHVANFVNDCRDDRLPSVSIIDPAFSIADDHPGTDPRLGEKFIGLIVDALTHSVSWASTALVILYDESGGFYDHVAPPAAFEGAASEDSPLGFRVPALVISPYAKRRFACKTVFDHTSILKSVSARWNVPFGPEFGARWPHAPSLWEDCFDFTQPPRPMGAYADEQMRDLDWNQAIQNPAGAPTSLVNRLEGFLERAVVVPALQALDRRSQVYDILTDLENSVSTIRRQT